MSSQQYAQTPYTPTFRQGSSRGGRSSSVASTPTSHGVLPSWGGPPSGQAFPYVSELSHMGMYQVHTTSGFASSSSSTSSDGGFQHWPGPSFASTRAPTGTLPAWTATPAAVMPNNSGVSQVYTEPSFLESTSGQGDVYNPQPSAFPEHGQPQPVANPIPVSRYSTLSMALCMPAPQHHATGQNHSSQNVDMAQNPNESANKGIRTGHDTLEAVQGTVNAPEGAINLVPGLTETPESPHPTIQPPTSPSDHSYHNTHNPSTSPTGPFCKSLTLVPTSDTVSTAMPPTVPQSSRKRARSRDTDHQVDFRFHIPVVGVNHIPTVPSQGSQGLTAPVQIVFPVERPPKVQRLSPELCERNEEQSRLVLLEWERIHKKLKDGKDVSFNGYIKSLDEYHRIFTSLLRCLEQNCPAERRFTQFSGLRAHVIQEHYVNEVTPRDGETKESASFLARIAVAEKEGEAKVQEDKYVTLKHRYRGLKSMVDRT